MTYKVCSWDVGIKNLAYCIIHKIEDVYNQAKTLNFKSGKKYETPTTIHIEKPNYYNILNIKPNATQEQIKKMFKRLSLAYHPDTEEDTGVNGDQKFRMIMEAYDVLKNPVKREHQSCRRV